MSTSTDDRRFLVSRKTVETSMGVVAYREAGRGPDVVLVHGALVTADDMVLALFEALSTCFHVVAFDRPGHGGTDSPSVDQGSAWRQAEMLHEAGKHIGLVYPVITGHSFGGAVALCTAMLFPNEISGVLAIAPICFPEPRLEQMLLSPRSLPVVGDLFARTIGAMTDTGTLPILRRAMFLPQVMPESYQADFPFAWASRPEQMIADAKDSVALWSGMTRSALTYASCETNVRIMGGTNDLVVNNGLHGLVASRLIPHGSFRWIPGYGHMLHHFQQSVISFELTNLFAQQTGSH